MNHDLIPMWTLLNGQNKYERCITKETLYKLSDLGKIELIKNTEGIIYVVRKSLEDYITFEESILSDYYNLPNAIKTMCEACEGTILTSSNHRSMKELIQKGLLRMITVEVPIRGSHSFYCKEDLHRFLKEYVYIEFHTEKKYGFKCGIVQRISKEHQIEIVKVGRYYFYHRNILKLLRDYQSFSPSDYFSIKEAMDLLRLSKKDHKIWHKLNKDHQLSYINRGPERYYFKQEIYALLNKQNVFKDQHYSADEVKEMLALSSHVPKELIKIAQVRIPVYASPLFPKLTVAFKKDTVDHYKIEYFKKREFYSVPFSNFIDSFHHKIKILNLDFNLSPMTEKLWIQYVENFLTFSNANPQTKAGYVSTLVNTTVHLAHLVRQGEAYYLSSVEINMMLKGIKRIHGEFLYWFLKELYDVVYENIGTPPSYEKQDILNPGNREQSYYLDIKPYTIQEYKLIDNYLKDMNLHKLNAINSARSKGEYASAWLFCLILLCNAWRPSDVIKLPRIDVLRKGTLDIPSLEWLEMNEINYDFAEKIINFLKIPYANGSVKVNKTQVKNKLSVSDNLVILIATAYILCEHHLRNIKSNSLLIMNIPYKELQPNRRLYKMLFYNFPDSIHFKAQKMNTTIITFLEKIASENGDSSIALQISKDFRRHVSEETTNRYIRRSQDGLYYLTKQIFDRGHFGFVYDIVASLLTGVESKNALRMKRNQEIESVKAALGKYYQIEASAGFLLQLSEWEHTVEEIIFSLGHEKATSLLINILLNKLPSKMEGIQCLVSIKGCIKVGTGVSCADCEYAIHNFYSLSTIAKGFVETLSAFDEKFKTSTLKFEKIKISNEMHIKFLRFQEAIRKFGKEVVYKFTEMEREKIIDLKEKVKLPMIEFRTIEKSVEQLQILQIGITTLSE
ncbi:hypothetical protein [Brevibacillus fortis]|uniref:Uncharacterized protein n=1 Tax=Brevibacillus fortis TaxID=2126352 RepID=A0A2P7VH36_9BACL|nr:hypothetical protein [Brevibacillus fortis]PSJ98541.1 hypothetical protein C7R93_06250 [Brevibacillus fortis]